MSTNPTQVTNALHEACRLGNLKKVKELIEKNPKSINQKHTLNDKTPIDIALIEGWVEIVDFILKQKLFEEEPISLLLFGLQARQNKAGILEKVIQHGNISKQNFELQNKEVEVLEAIALPYVEQQLSKLKKQAKTDDDWRELARYQNGRGVAYFYKKQFEATKQSLTMAIEAMSKLTNKTDDDWRKLAKYRNNMGAVYYHKNQYEEAIQSYTTVIEAMSKFTNKTDDDWRNLAKNHYRMGTVYYDKKQFEAAIKLYTAAIEAMSKLTNKTDDDWRNLAEYHGRMGAVYYDKKQFETAIKPCTAAIKAISKLTNKTDDDWRNLAEYHCRMGGVYFDKKQFKAAIKPCTAAIEAMSKLTNKTDDDWRKLAQYRHNQGLTYINQNQVEAATQSITMAIEAMSKIQQKIPSDWHKNLFLMYKDRNLCYKKQLRDVTNSAEKNTALKRAQCELMQEGIKLLRGKIEEENLQVLRKNLISSVSPLTYANLQEHLVIMNYFYEWMIHHNKTQNEPQPTMTITPANPGLPVVPKFWPDMHAKICDLTQGLLNSKIITKSSLIFLRKFSKVLKEPNSTSANMNCFTQELEELSLLHKKTLVLMLYGLKYPRTAPSYYVNSPLVIELQANNCERLHPLIIEVEASIEKAVPTLVQMLTSRLLPVKPQIKKDYEEQKKLELEQGKSVKKAEKISAFSKHEPKGTQLKLTKFFERNHRKRKAPESKSTNRSNKRVKKLEQIKYTTKTTTTTTNIPR